MLIEDLFCYLQILCAKVPPVQPMSLHESKMSVLDDLGQQHYNRNPNLKKSVRKIAKAKNSNLRHKLKTLPICDKSLNLATLTVPLSFCNKKTLTTNSYRLNCQ